MVEKIASSPVVLEEEKETGRIEAFSDGVFAIAITLLVLDFKVPKPADLATKSLAAALANQWPTFLSYTISFLTVLIMWMNHHKLFRHIHRTDQSFMLLNGLLLMMVTAVPFPTAILSAYINGTHGRTAVAIYSGTFLIIAVLYQMLWKYAYSRHLLLSSRRNLESVAAINRQYRFGPLYYLVAFLLAFLNVWASIAACIALAVFFALPGVKRLAPR